VGKQEEKKRREKEKWTRATVKHAEGLHEMLKPVVAQTHNITLLI